MEGHAVELKIYDHADLEKAVEAVRNKTMSIRKAAAAFHVPESTIFDKLIGRRYLHAIIGRRPSLPENIEEKIPKNVMRRQNGGWVYHGSSFSKEPLYFVSA